MKFAAVDLMPLIKKSEGDFPTFVKSVIAAITADMHLIVSSSDISITEQAVVNLCVARTREYVNEFEKLPGVKPGEFAKLLKRAWKVEEDEQPLSRALRYL